MSNLISALVKILQCGQQLSHARGHTIFFFSWRVFEYDLEATVKTLPLYTNDYQ